MAIAEEPISQDVQIGVQDDSYADTDPSALTDYRSTLDPYGTWVEDTEYGTIWLPSDEQVGVGFTPYVSAGHWVYDDEYIWVSDYAWGWVPFHYGRWVWIHGRGWAWIPGRTYAGAWVVWRVGDDEWGYLGWAPMPPTWIWRGRIAVGIHTVPWVPYVFCPREHVFAPVIATHVVVGERAAVIASHTRSFVHAAPVVSVHPLAQPFMQGPPPATLRVDPSHVVHPTPGDHGVLHAQQFAHPSTAQPLGARPAVPHIVQSRPMVMPSPSNVPRTAPRAIPSGGGRRK